MSQLQISSSTLGTSLQELLMVDEIQPGSAPSYQICKTIYAMHPLGLKMAEAPINMAQSQPREIAIPNSPEERVRDAFLKEWEAIGADKHIFNVMRLSRVYGIASLALIVEGLDSKVPVDYFRLARETISFNVLDPLNTAGSLVLNQNPNAPDFQKVVSISISGKEYHRSRACVMLNGDPLYIEYTTSAFGYVGRSVYQRALFPLKSFVQSMITDDMVVKKAGLLVAMMKQVGSIIDNVMSTIAGIKRALLAQGQTGNVLSIGETEKIETLNMQNLDGAYSLARKNILENIAVSDDMPAKLLNSETFAEGFGEGTEDAKNVARYVERIRRTMAPLYVFFDKIVQHRAWNEDFYKDIQKDFPEQYGKVEYKTAFYQWQNSFAALWPSLLIEPESEQVKVEDVKLKAAVALVEVLMPTLDPENKATLVRWAADNFNELKLMFQSPLVLDYDALASYEPPVAEKPVDAAPPFSARDSMSALDEAVKRLPDRRSRRVDEATVRRVMEALAAR